ncbi:hypothetical protein E2320_010808, partial [Naja naja]
MFEIQTLCQYLEKSIYTNDLLREQLETYLTSMAKSNELEHLQKAQLELHSKLQDGKVKLEWQRIERQQLQEDIQSKQQDLVLLQKEAMALQMNNSRLQHRMIMLQQQCEENRALFQTQQAELWTHNLLLTGDVKNQGIHIFCQKNIKNLLVHTTTLHQILEKSTSLLTMFWRASPPMPLSSAQIRQHTKGIAEEIQILRAKLAEQENRVQSANHIKGNLENFILTH